MEALATNGFLLSKGGPLATRIWTLAPTKKRAASVLNLVLQLVLEIRANGQRTNASDSAFCGSPNGRILCRRIRPNRPAYPGLAGERKQSKIRTKNWKDLRAV